MHTDVQTQAMRMCSHATQLNAAQPRDQHVRALKPQNFPRPSTVSMANLMRRHTEVRVRTHALAQVQEISAHDITLGLQQPRVPDVQQQHHARA